MMRLNLLGAYKRQDPRCLRRIWEREWYKTNRARVCALKRRRDTTDEARARRNARNSVKRAEINEQQRIWCQRNKASVKASNAKWRQAHLEAARRAVRFGNWRAAGLNPEEAEARRQAATKCAICSSNKKLVVDHDHQTGRIRGVICDDCNLALGRFKDSIAVLWAAIQYLSAAGRTVSAASPSDAG